ncbi:MAG: hypothetical protein AAF993_08015 [Pseudomonadota bacterium]
MTKSQIQLIVIMMVAFVSLGGSYLLFYFAKTEGGWGTTNNGVFVTPQTTLAELGWQVEGKFAQDVEGHWWLWVVTDDCDAGCQQSIKDLRALHVLLNKEAERVRRGFTGSERAWQKLAEQFPALAHVRLSSGRSLENGIYIADPLGNLVFHYAPNTNPKLVQEDLKKLLKVSQIG